MSTSIRGKVALVTGASKGIGRAAALALARAGANVAVTARSGELLAGLAREIEACGVGALPVTADVTKSADVEKLKARTLETFRRVDILVNNVGIARYASFAELTIQDYDWMMNTNMRSTFMVTKAFLPGMLERGQGSVVFVASVSGLFGFPGETAYCASKHAQVGFARALEREVYAKGVKVTVIAPGGVNTEHAIGTGRTAGDPHLQTFLEADDVAEAVLYAASQAAKSRVFLIGMRPMSEGYYD